jgi:hypothetical protein
MQIPLDHIYPYLQSRFSDAVVLRFWPHGSRDISSLKPVSSCSDRDLCQKPAIISHDQEPLDYGAYGLVSTEMQSWLDSRGIDAKQAPDLNLGWACFNNAYQQQILLTGDASGPDLDRYRNDPALVPVHFWSHAVIARDWFRYAESDPELQLPRNLQYVFNVYCRAWSGSREYRLALLSRLQDSGLTNDSRVKFSAYDQGQHYTRYQFHDDQWHNIHQGLEQWCLPNTAESHSSASYSAQDYRTTLFDLVLETVIDRVHVTEKTLRALACAQPFVIMAGAGTLAYLRDHGYQTYSHLFDESYDLCDDPAERMQRVIATMHTIVQHAKDPKWVAELERIARWNQQWFFSRDLIRGVIDGVCLGIEHALPRIQTHVSVDRLRHIDRARAQYRQRRLDQQIMWTQEIDAVASYRPDHSPLPPGQS